MKCGKHRHRYLVTTPDVYLYGYFSKVLETLVSLSGREILTPFCSTIRSVNFQGGISVSFFYFVLKGGVTRAGEKGKVKTYCPLLCRFGGMICIKE